MDLTILSKQLGKYLDMPSQLPPVDKWNPALSGDIDIFIDKNGQWFHEGNPILREKLMRLFSTILKREDNEYFLVTPVEKWRIRVEDQPFVVVLMNIVEHQGGQNIQMITNTGDEFEVGMNHPLELDGHEAPKVLVREGMYARLNRNVFYELAEMGQETEEGYFIESAGEKFKIGCLIK